jgi:hypothetical protein
MSTWRRYSICNIGIHDIGWVKSFCRSSMLRGWINTMRVTRPKWWRLRWTVEIAGDERTIDGAGYDHLEGSYDAIVRNLPR